MPPEEPSVREALDAAITASEAPPAEAPAPSPAPAPAPAEHAEAPAPAEEHGDKPQEVQAETEGKPKAMSPASPPEDPYAEAPKSWRTGSRVHWAGIPKEAKDEIIRRDREVFRIFGESANARKLAGEFQQVVQPYLARIQSGNQSPLQAVRNLLDYDHALATSPPQRKAQLAAQLIKDYGIDIRELDAALSGTPMADPVQAAIDRALAERLQPFNQYIQNQQQQEQYRNQGYVEEASQVVERMSSDNTKFPHFEQVREDMADLVEVAAKRGLYLDPQQAYNRAVAMNSELGARVAAQQQAESARQAASVQHARAQKALTASSSVAGAPTGTPGAGGSGGSVRDAVEAAFNSVTSR